MQELVEKSQHPEILSQCPEIKWHLIGHLQSNKINKVGLSAWSESRLDCVNAFNVDNQWLQVLKLPNLHMIQTVDSEKLANSLDAAWSKVQPEANEPLRVLVQINTSEEDGKQISFAPRCINYLVEITMYSKERS